MVATAAHTKAAEEEHGHKWDVTDKKWEELPKEDAEFKLTAIKQEVESDPPFNSHSGYETRHSAADLVNSDGVAHVKYNFDPELDKDVIDTHQHLGDSEDRLGHVFQANLQVQSEVDALEKEFQDLEQKALAESKQKTKDDLQRLAVESMAPKPTQSLVQTGVTA